MRCRGAGRAAVLLLVTWLAACAGPAAARAPRDLHFGHTALTIATAHGAYRFQVELARTPAQMEHGLMFRRHLPADGGMLFEYPGPVIARFWMHDTLIPLDMLFVAATGRVVNIAANAQPLSDRVISSAAPVTGVIELRGGTAARLGIVPGDRVENPFFGASR